MTRTIYTDGSPKGRVAVVIPGNNPVPESHVIAIPAGKTNNEAEYLAVLESFNWIDDNSDWVICSDSKLVVMQIVGLWKCRADNLQPLLEHAHYWVDNFPVKIEFKWVPRTQNLAGILLDDVLSFERQVEKEMKDEQKTGKIRPYAQRILRGL